MSVDALLRSLDVFERLARAAEVHTGAMVALVPSDEDTKRLAVPGGEPVDRLHLTLRYLGKAVDFGGPSQAHLVELVRAYFASFGPVTGDLFSLAIFNPAGDEPAIVGLVGGDDVARAYNATAAAVEDYGADLPAPRQPFAAHVTLVFSGDASRVADLVDRVGSITFDRVRVAFGGVITDIPLTGVSATRDWKTQPRDPGGEDGGQFMSAGRAMDELAETFGVLADESAVGDKHHVQAHDGGRVVLTVDAGEDKRGVLRDFSQDDAHALADQVEEMIREAEAEDYDDDDDAQRPSYEPRDVAGDTSVDALADLNETFDTTRSHPGNTRKFDKDQLRDPGGEGGGQWVTAGGALKDALKLAGKIRLDDGEELLGSDKVSADDGTVRLAVTGKDGQRALRIGLGDGMFGSRDDEAGPWRGQESLAELNADRQKIQDERTRLEDEDARLWEQRDPLSAKYVASLHDGPPISVEDDAELDRIIARQDEIEKRLGEIEDLDTSEVFASGYTAKLDSAAAAQLRDILADANKRAKVALAEVEAAWDAIPDGTVNPDLPHVEVAVGSIPAESGRVHYRVVVDEPESGPQTDLWVVPDGMTSEDVEFAEARAHLYAAESAKVVRLLDKMLALAGTRSARKFDKDQLRDPDGKWTDGVPGAAETVGKIGGWLKGKADKVHYHGLGIKGAHFSVDYKGTPLDLTVSPLDVVSLGLMFVPGGEVLAAAKLADLLTKGLKAKKAAKFAKVAAAVAGHQSGFGRDADFEQLHPRSPDDGTFVHSSFRTLRQLFDTQGLLVTEESPLLQPDTYVGRYWGENIVVTSDAPHLEGEKSPGRAVHADYLDPDSARAVADVIDRMYADIDHYIDDPEDPDFADESPAEREMRLVDYEVIPDLDVLVGYNPDSEILIGWPKDGVKEPDPDRLETDFDVWHMDSNDASNFADTLREVADFDPEEEDTVSVGGSYDVTLFTDHDIALTSDGGGTWDLLLNIEQAKIARDTLAELRDLGAGVEGGPAGSRKLLHTYDVEAKSDGTVTIAKIGDAGRLVTIPAGDLSEMVEALDAVIDEAEWNGRGRHLAADEAAEPARAYSNQQRAQRDVDFESHHPRNSEDGKFVGSGAGIAAALKALGSEDDGGGISFDDSRYIDWSSTGEDGCRSYEVSGGKESVVLPLDDDEEQRLSRALALTRIRESLPDQRVLVDLAVERDEDGLFDDGAVTFDDGRYFDWSTRHSDGSRTLEAGDSVEAAQVELSAEEFNRFQATLALSLLTDDDAEPDSATRAYDKKLHPKYPKGTPGGKGGEWMPHVGEALGKLANLHGRGPVKVRPEISRLKSVADVNTRLRIELRRTLGRPVDVDLGQKTNLITAKEYAEGLLRGAERWPETRLDKVSVGKPADGLDVWGTATVHPRSGAVEVLLDESTAMSRTSNLQRLRRGGAHGRPGNDFAYVAASLFGSAVDAMTGGRGHEHVDVAVKAYLGDAGLDHGDPGQVQAGIKAQLGDYALRSREAMVAEALADDALHGDGASPLAQRVRQQIATAYNSTLSGRPMSPAPSLRPADAGGLSDDPAVREAQVENRIREAYSDLIADRPGTLGWVQLADLRERLGGVDKATVDAVLDRMIERPDVLLMEELNTKTLTARDNDAAVVIGDQPRHLLKIQTAPAKTAKKAAPAKKGTAAAPAVAKATAPAASDLDAIVAQLGELNDRSAAEDALRGMKVTELKALMKRMGLGAGSGKKKADLVTAVAAKVAAAKKVAPRTSVVPGVDYSDPALLKSGHARDIADALEYGEDTPEEIIDMYVSDGLSREMASLLVNETVLALKAQGKMPGPAVGRDLIAVDAAGLADQVAAQRDQHRSADQALSVIAAMQGFDRTPTVASAATIDQLVLTGHTEVFRGADQRDGSSITGAEKTEQLRSGSAYFGNGLYGNGYYFTDNHDDARNYTDDDDHGIARAVLHKDAKVIDYKSISDEAFRYTMMETGKPGSNAAKAFGDVGRYAAARGYDAIVLDIGQPGGPRPNGLGTKNYVILNRTALTVEEASGVS